jgi:hypothetical protein
MRADERPPSPALPLRVELNTSAILTCCSKYWGESFEQLIVIRQKPPNVRQRFAFSWSVIINYATAGAHQSGRIGVFSHKMKGILTIGIGWHIC